MSTNGTDNSLQVSKDLIEKLKRQSDTDLIKQTDEIFKLRKPTEDDKKYFKELQRQLLEIPTSKVDKSFAWNLVDNLVRQYVEDGRLDLNRSEKLASITMILGYFPWPPPTGTLVTFEVYADVKAIAVRDLGKLAIEFSVGAGIQVAATYHIGFGSKLKDTAKIAGIGEKDFDIRKKIPTGVTAEMGTKLKSLLTKYPSIKTSALPEASRESITGSLSIGLKAKASAKLAIGTVDQNILNWQFGENARWLGWPECSATFGWEPVGVTVELAGKGELRAVLPPMVIG
jgi:hypothetical protein